MATCSPASRPPLLFGLCDGSQLCDSGLEQGNDFAVAPMNGGCERVGPSLRLVMRISASLQQEPHAGNISPERSNVKGSEP